MRETELAAAVVRSFQEYSYEVYQEVLVGERVADVVAVLGSVVSVVECKTSLSLSVLGQAERWLPYANNRYVAVPKQKRDKRGRERRSVGRDYAAKCLSRDGTGLLEVSASGRVLTKVPPGFNRRTPRREELLDCLNPAQKILVAAGGNSGGYWTPFKDTVRRVRRYVEEHPGCALKDLLEAVQTHYASPHSARSCLARYVQLGVIEGVTFRREGRYLRRGSGEGPGRVRGSPALTYAIKSQKKRTSPHFIPLHTH